MVYHGVSDAIFSVNDTTTWYEGVRAANAGDASDFARFFRVPGMAHCAGGPSTDQFDMLTALVDWVEKAGRPTRWTAYARGAGKRSGESTPTCLLHGSPRRSRPLCHYPQGRTPEGRRHGHRGRGELQLQVRVRGSAPHGTASRSGLALAAAFATGTAASAQPSGPLWRWSTSP